MIILKTTRIEKKLTIVEQDIVNSSEALVLEAYAVKEDYNLYSYPAPYIVEKDIYERNKVAYDNAVKEFRAECEVE